MRTVKQTEMIGLGRELFRLEFGFRASMTYDKPNHSLRRRTLNLKEGPTQASSKVPNLEKGENTTKTRLPQVFDREQSDLDKDKDT